MTPASALLALLEKAGPKIQARSRMVRLIDPLGLLLSYTVQSVASIIESIETAGDIPAGKANQYNVIYVEAVVIASQKQQTTVQMTSNVLNMTRKFIG